MTLHPINKNSSTSFCTIEAPQSFSLKTFLEKSTSLFRNALGRKNCNGDVIWVKALSSRAQIIKCSLGDHLAARVGVPVVFLHRAHIPKDLIINSLQTVLQNFPIFSGKLIEKEGHLHIDCNNQGVRVTTVHSEQPLPKDLSDPAKIDFMPFVDMLDAAKAVKEKQPMLTIKLNYHPDGMVIGYCWNHTIGDMATFMTLLKAMSACAQGANYQPGVVIDDRDLFLRQQDLEKDNRVSQGSFLKYLGFLDIVRLVQRVFSSKRIVYLHFTQEEIENLRNALKAKVNVNLSRNDVLSAHVLKILSQCQDEKEKKIETTLVVNTRPRMGMPSHILGNFVDFIFIKTSQPQDVEGTAKKIHFAVQNYLATRSHYRETEQFVQDHGGVKNMNRILPKMFFPPSKNVCITNWSNFGVYSIDFGVNSPSLFLPAGRALLPWLGCIVEGPENKGLSFSLALPTNVAKKLTHPAMLQQVHKYRKPVEG